MSGRHGRKLLSSVSEWSSSWIRRGRKQKKVWPKAGFHIYLESRAECANKLGEGSKGIRVEDGSEKFQVSDQMSWGGFAEWETRGGSGWGVRADAWDVPSPTACGQPMKTRGQPEI